MSESSKFYLSTYCNFSHRVKDGKPIDHECRIIPPKAIQAEMAGDFDEAIRVMASAPVKRFSRGVKMGV